MPVHPTGAATAMEPFNLRRVEAEAERIRTEARAEAERRIAEASAEVEAIRAEARKRGEREGREAGESTARVETTERLEKEGRERLDRDATAIRDLVSALDREREGLSRETIEAVRDRMGDLVREIVRRVLRAELRTDPETVARTIEEALRICTVRDGVTIRVHPEDLAAARRALGEDPAFRQVAWKEDATMERGGCVVTTTGSEVDARIESQLAELDRALGLVSGETEPAADGQGERDG